LTTQADQPAEGDKLKDWITTAEAGRLLGLTARRIRQLIDEGEIEAQKLTPRMTLVTRASVERYRLKK
jgi:excisionase family DNA binding protein